MGLAERKVVATVKDTEFKMFEAKVKEICGFDVKLDFDWGAAEGNKELTWICENKKFNYYMWEPVTTALTTVCADAMGKDAIKAGLKEIKMIPATGDLSFTNGVLTIHNDLTGNGAYGADRIQETLEKGL